MHLSNPLQPLFITDAVTKMRSECAAEADIVSNTIDLCSGLGLGTPNAASLSATLTRATNTLAKGQSFPAGVDATSIVPSARMPIVHTSRANCTQSSRSSRAVAVLYGQPSPLTRQSRNE